MSGKTLSTLQYFWILFFFFNPSFTSPSPSFQHYLVLVLVLNDGNHLATSFRRRGVTFKKLDMFIMLSGGLWSPH